MNHKMIEKIEACMRYVYAHFLEEDESLIEVIGSQKFLHARARHAVRTRIFVRFPASGSQICEAEKRIKGKKPDTSTIYHSVRRVHQGKVNRLAVDEIDKLIDEFEDYWRELKEPPVQSQIHRYMEMDHHVLALIVAMAIDFGWAEKTKMEGLYREFRTVSREFVEGL